ncbi:MULTISPECIES: hypothetical protein [Rhizobium]|uniref:Uncharacterized protein n=1 Tax=Rhizobium paranaense TaxID=1650438 RepID=A0A7W9D4L5_9HYPH|nr:hypothetical protein [Rhizobium paranaense]MBB5577370.1 hypothetical protein [Rhizobium paranaense]
MILRHDGDRSNAPAGQLPGAEEPPNQVGHSLSNLDVWWLEVLAFQQDLIAQGGGIAPAEAWVSLARQRDNHTKRARAGIMSRRYQQRQSI